VSRESREPGCRVFEHRLPVRPSDIDGAGHLNHVAMLGFFEFARVRAHREVREASPEMPDMNTVVRRATVDYHGQARVFDELLVRSWVRKDGGSSRTWEQELLRPDGGLVARVEVISVLVDPASWRPTRLPGAYRDAFEAWVEDREPAGGG
jgi:acyl-CoA thioester hydrolase